MRRNSCWWRWFLALMPCLALTKTWLPRTHSQGRPCTSSAADRPQVTWGGVPSVLPRRGSQSRGWTSRLVLQFPYYSISWFSFLYLFVHFWSTSVTPSSNSPIEHGCCLSFLTLTFSDFKIFYSSSIDIKCISEYIIVSLQFSSVLCIVSFSWILFSVLLLLGEGRMSLIFVLLCVCVSNVCLCLATH